MDCAKPLVLKRFSEAPPLILKMFDRNDRLYSSGKGGKPMKAGHLIANGSVPTSSFLHDGGGEQPWEMAAKGGNTNRMKAKEEWEEL